MAKKKSDKKQDMRSPEQLMRDITRMLADRDFASMDEMNQFLQEHLESGQPVPASLPETDLDRAQDLVYKAHEARTQAQALKLVRQALDISPDCADGYVLLAELTAQTLAEEWAFYEAGVRAGERALGADFEAVKGHFWGHIETRPYMRARMGLAVTLWNLGRLEEAAQHMSTMLELNPNDNQGVRHLFITLLLELNDIRRMEKLLKQYPDDWSAYWKYGQALYEFRKNGPGGKADEILADAIDYNPHVPSYLLGKKKLPKQPSAPYYSPGDETEALDYIIDGIRPWTATEGALQWLEDMLTKLNEPDNPS